MDIAQKVFACFDQNDLKAPIALTVRADPRVDGARQRPHPRRATAGAWRFATTPPIPPALFVVAAGPWALAARGSTPGCRSAGTPARRSPPSSTRDVDELRAITEGCFDHYAEIFDEPYPFDSYDQVFVPGLNWGALEMPGCVTYRDEFLPRGAGPRATCGCSAPPSSRTRWRTCGSATW